MNSPGEKRASSAFYWSDWMGDTALRSCGVAARGIWMDMLALAHEGTPYGHLRAGRKNLSDPAVLARLVGERVEVVEDALAELEDAGVFSRDEAGVIYCRRMVRDRARRDEEAERQRRSRDKRRDGDRDSDVTDAVTDGDGHGPVTPPPTRARRPARARPGKASESESDLQPETQRRTGASPPPPPEEGETKNGAPQGSRKGRKKSQPPESLEAILAAREEFAAIRADPRLMPAFERWREYVAVAPARVKAKFPEGPRAVELLRAIVTHGVPAFERAVTLGIRREWRSPDPEYALEADRRNGSATSSPAAQREVVIPTEGPVAEFLADWQEAWAHLRQGSYRVEPEDLAAFTRLAQHATRAEVRQRIMAILGREDDFTRRRASPAQLEKAWNEYAAGAA